MSADNLYNILGVSRGAEKSEIRGAYQKLIIPAHPDHGGTNEHFQKIKKAFDVLGDPIKRSKYDRNGTVDSNETVHIVTDGILLQCRERFRGSEPEKQAIRNAWVAHRGSLVKVLKDIPFMWSYYTDRSDPERQRVKTIIDGK